MSVTPSLETLSSSKTPESSGGFSNRAKHRPSFFREVLACFQSIHLAIVLLAILAVGILIGVLLPQEGLVEFQRIRTTYGPWTRLMKAMGFFNVYSSYWFLCVQVLFFFNLLLGSFKWLKPAFMSATRKTFCSAQSIQKAKHSFKLSSSENEAKSLSILLSELKQRRYSVCSRRNPNHPEQWEIYATKGNIGRLGPAVAHVGILVFLVASVYGNFVGFKAQQAAVPGQTFELRHVEKIMRNLPESLWLGSIPDWRIRVKDFHIVFYPEHPETPKQYYTDLEVLNRLGGRVSKATISVNHPLAIGDLTFYQASFAPTGRLFFQINDKVRPVTINTNFGNRPVSMTPLSKSVFLVVFPFVVQQDPGITKNRVRIMLMKDGHFAGAGQGHMPDNLRLEEGQSGVLDGIHLTFNKLEYATGLQIKSAPEIPWVYLGYVIIALGTLMCLFAQRQLWISLSPHQETQRYEIFCLYRTNKARLLFLKELEAFRQNLQRTLIHGAVRS